MKRISLILSLLVLLVLPSNAFAKVSDKYVGLKVGYSSITAEATLVYGDEPEFDKRYGAVNLGGVFGATLAKMGGANLRFELEGLVRFGSGKADAGVWLDTVETTISSSLLGGLYLDFPINDNVTPYAGVLLGLHIFGYEAKTYTTLGTVKETGTGVNGQYGLGAGVAFKVNPRMSLDLGARYLWSTEYEIDYDDHVSWSTDLGHKILDVSLGFRYHF